VPCLYSINVARFLNFDSVEKCRVAIGAMRLNQPVQVFHQAGKLSGFASAKPRRMLAYSPQTCRGNPPLPEISADGYGPIRVPSSISPLVIVPPTLDAGWHLPAYSSRPLPVGPN